MHHVTLDAWSRLSSPIHRLDARAKILASLVILLSLALTDRSYVQLLMSHFCLITALALAARLPLGALLLRGMLVLPFAGGVAVLNLFGGDLERAAGVLGKSYLSACTVLLLLATTPLPSLFRGLEFLAAPRFLLMVAHFVYRYLFVLSEQAQHMIQARRCRNCEGRGRLRLSWRSASSTIAVLFARSYARAERIHQAMLARGFQGHFVLLRPPSFHLSSLVFLIATSAVVGCLHLFL